MILLLVVSVFLAVFTKHLGSDFTFTLEHFKILPQRGWNSTRNTLVFATITSVIMSAAGIVVAYTPDENSVSVAELTLSLMLSLAKRIPAADREAVIDTILRVAQLAADFPQLLEVEINPLRVLETGQGAVAVDARARV